MQADTLFSGSVVRDTVITAEGALPRTAADTVNVSLAEATGEAVSTVQGFVDTFFASLPRVAVGIVVLLFFWLVAKGVRSAIHRITPGPIDSPIGMVLAQRFGITSAERSARLPSGRPVVYSARPRFC